MNKDFEAAYHQIEGAHWWSVSRRDMILRLLDRGGVSASARVLDVGCASGRLLLQLRERGHRVVEGIDIAPEAVQASRARGLDRVRVMQADQLEHPDCAFDALIASDVLEHVEADQTALAEWYRVLAPGGVLVVFVPAFRSLWSAHDERNQHYRRYARRELVDKLTAAGFEVERSAFWNLALVAPAWLVRNARRLFRVEASPLPELAVPSSLLNRTLLRWLRVENWLLERVALGPGVSVWAVARRPAPRESTP